MKDEIINIVSEMKNTYMESGDLFPYFKMLEDCIIKEFKESGHIGKMSKSDNDVDNNQKGIIEKLGITPLNQYYNKILDLDIFSTQQIREVESQRNEMLKALIDVLEMYEGDGFPDASFLYDPLFKKIGTSWSEIKELLNEQ